MSGMHWPFWISEKNSTGIPGEAYRRCWPFHLAMKPFYHLAPQIWTERAFYAFFPIWRWWLKRQFWPDCNVVQAIIRLWYRAVRLGGQTWGAEGCGLSEQPPDYLLWISQREYDIWCPGEKVPIPMDVRSNEPRVGKGGFNYCAIEVLQRNHAVERHFGGKNPCKSDGC